MAAAPETVTLRVKVDDDSYRETLGRLHTLADLAKEAQPRSVVAEVIHNATIAFLLMWVGAVIGHVAGW